MNNRNKERVLGQRVYHINRRPDDLKEERMTEAKVQKTTFRGANHLNLNPNQI